MNLICIVSDTVRADYLGCYGNDWVKTPNLDRLAREGILFKNAYVEGLPTIPERTVFFTGKYTIPFRTWQPLWPHDITLAQILGKKGVFQVETLGKENYVNSLITSTYHYTKPGMNFHRGFHSFKWIRGQEIDIYNTDPTHGRDFEKYLPEDLRDGIVKRMSTGTHRGGAPAIEWYHQYHQNVADRKCEEDYFPAQTFKAAIHWLEGNRVHDKFFLWVDEFDPHEPWDPPVRYYKMYSNPSYQGPMPIWHYKGAAAKNYTDDEIHEIKACYAGELSLVDHWIGELLNKIDKLGLRSNTVVVFLSDHGTAHGEHGQLGKGLLTYREITRIPLIIRHPQGPKGKRIDQLVWTPDFAPTILDILEIEAPRTMHGKSFWPLVTNEADTVRNHIFSGIFHPFTELMSAQPPPDVDKSFIKYVCDGEWSAVRHILGGKFQELYDLRDDPKELQNVASGNPERLEEMEKKATEFVEKCSSLKP